MENTQHNSEHNHNNATMPQETGHKMKDMYDDMEEITDDDENQYRSNDQDSQLEELVRRNTRQICYSSHISNIQVLQSYSQIGCTFPYAVR